MYRHRDPSLASNIHRNLLGCSGANVVIGTDVSTRNRNLQRYNTSSFLINPLILATSAIIRRRASFVKPCGRFRVK
jgi:hypothetical protein